MLMISLHSFVCWVNNSQSLCEQAAISEHCLEEKFDLTILKKAKPFILFLLYCRVYINLDRVLFIQ
jgi:hypothetical protein